jgi:V8-like Glu-specific endopeptidase
MNKRTRSFELLLLVLAAACGPDASALLGNESAASPGGSEVASHRSAPLFNRSIREQLAARGVNAYGGQDTAPERTTVEESWVVPGNPMTRVPEPDPTTAPRKYTVQVGTRKPLTIADPITNRPTIDRTNPDPLVPGTLIEDNCSGTLIGSDVVLTAAHCVYDWVEIGVDPNTRDTVFEKVRKYSINIRPRRNGQDIKHLVHKNIGVKKAAWDFAKWPSNLKSNIRGDGYFYDEDQDYAVLRLKKSPALAAASIGTNPTPPGLKIELVGYPYGLRRGWQMWDSTGYIDKLDSEDFNGSSHQFTRSFVHSAGAEPGSSGSGVYDFTALDTVIGVHLGSLPFPNAVQSPGAIQPGFPNFLLMLTPDMVTNIGTWQTTVL